MIASNREVCVTDLSASDNDCDTHRDVEHLPETFLKRYE